MGVTIRNKPVHTAVTTPIAKVMGIDISTHTGVSVIAAIPDTQPFVTTISLTETTGFDRAMRLAALVGDLADKHLPTMAVIEGYAFGNKFSLGTLVEIGTLIRYQLIKRGVPVWTLSPPSLKKFVTGSGTAAKSQMMMQVFKHWKFEAADDNQADAYALAMAGLHHQGVFASTAIQKSAVSTLQLIACSPFQNVI